MVQAAAEGAIDFSQADNLDPHWWRKVKWITDYLSRKNRKELYHEQLSQHMAVADYDLPQLTFEHHWDSGNELINKICNMLLPWIDTTPPTPEEIAAKLYERYVEEFGAPGTEEHDSEMQRLIEYWSADRKPPDAAQSVPIPDCI